MQIKSLFHLFQKKTKFTFNLFKLVGDYMKRAEWQKYLWNF